MKPRGRYGAVDPSNPEAAGRCAIGAEVRKRSELFKQMAWRGDRLAWTGLWVCAQHMDQPHPQDRAKRLSADPVPVRDPLPNIDFKPDRIISLVPGVASTVALGTPAVALEPPQALSGVGGVASTAVGVPEVASVLLLDGLAQEPTLAFSTRLLRAAYSGGICMRVRRSSDNAEADIGFADGALDTAALLAHVGAGDGFVVRWHDQSAAGGGTRYWNNTTAASQPRIVLAGVVEAINGKPAARALTSSARMTMAGSPAYQAVAPSEIFAVHGSTNGNGNWCVVCENADNGTANGIRQLRNGRAFYGTGYSANPGALTDGAAHFRHGTYPAVGAGITPSVRIDGTLATVGALAGTAAAPLGAGFNFGSRAGASAELGWLAEVIVLDEAGTEATRLAVQASVGGYYGITMA